MIVGAQAAVHQAAQIRARQVQSHSIILPRPPFPPFHRQLLMEADRLRQLTEWKLAIVVAQTACELVIELAISTLLTRRGIPELEQPIDSLLPSYNPDNKNVRKLYEALSGDKVTGKPFWTEVTTLARLRHKVVHKGAAVTEQQAADAIAAATSLVSHVESVLQDQPVEV